MYINKSRLRQDGEQFLIRDETDMRVATKNCPRQDLRVLVHLVLRPRQDRDSRPSLTLDCFLEKFASVVFYLTVVHFQFEVIINKRLSFFHYIRIKSSWEILSEENNFTTSTQIRARYFVAFNKKPHCQLNGNRGANVNLCPSFWLCRDFHKHLHNHRCSKSQHTLELPSLMHESDEVTLKSLSEAKTWKRTNKIWYYRRTKRSKLMLPEYFRANKVLVKDLLQKKATLICIAYKTCVIS